MSVSAKFARFCPFRCMHKRTMPTLPHLAETAYERATFGMGCFWGNDALYGAVPGVLRTVVGYAGGTKMNPKYRDLGDHTEVIEIHYDPMAVSYEQLIEMFWNNHEYDLTAKMKRQYMSLVLYHNEDQKRIAERSMAAESEKRRQQVGTEIASAKEFYPAEDYHQKYRLQRHPWLCEMIQITPELLQKSHIAARLNAYVAGLGKHDDVERDLRNFGLSDKVVEYVRKEWQNNKGGTLFC